MKIIEIGKRLNMLKLDNGTKSSWYKIPETYTEGLELAKTLKVNDEVEVKFTIVNGVSVVNQLIKAGSPPAPQEKVMETEVKKEIGSDNNFNKPAVIPKYTCKKCGKPMKDDKYENCYTCNQGEWKGKNEDRTNSIERQAIGKMTATTIAHIADKMSVESLLDLIDQVYDKYKQKVIG